MWCYLFKLLKLTNKNKMLNSLILIIKNIQIKGLKFITIQTQIAYYNYIKIIVIIITILLIIYFNPLILLETLAETNEIEDLKKKINEITEELSKAEKNIKAMDEKINNLRSLSKTLVICVLIVMAISGYNWEAMYKLKEILSRK